MTEDGLNWLLHVATPEWFGETKRLKKAMDDKWHENDPRVVAHDDTVQEIRKTNKAKDKNYNIWTYQVAVGRNSELKIYFENTLVS